MEDEYCAYPRSTMPTEIASENSTIGDLAGSRGINLDQDSFEFLDPFEESTIVNSVSGVGEDGEDLAINIQQEDTESDVVKPFEGMLYESLQVAQSCYVQYGRMNGFQTRICSTQKKKDSDETSYCRLVCARQGHHSKTSREVDTSEKAIKTRSTSTQKCGCVAQMRLVKTDEGKWKVSVFSDVHNHKFVSPAKRVRMRVNRIMPDVAKSLAEAFYEENLPVGKVCSVLDGGTIGFDERDCWNHLNSSKKYKTTKDGDATAALSYFKRKSLEDPQFFYNIQTDTEGRAVNFFWVDGRSRSQYIHFGDVVCFDTTYKKNVYEMPFGPFTGVNHHYQSIQFGCGLLLDETEESFVWLFETWLAAMGGRPPISLITDQDKAMTSAIAKVFPNTRHRFCFWHIKTKFVEKFPHLYTNKPKFKEDLQKCFWWPFKAIQFEERWKKILVEYDLVEHPWLIQLYEMREKWVPVYHYNTFYAGMNTTGRSEGMNSFFKDYFNHNTNLIQFTRKFDKCLERISTRERDEDYSSEHLDRIVDGAPCIQRHAAKLYTRHIYEKFKIEVGRALSDYKFHQEIIGTDYNRYIVRSWKIGDHVEWNVEFNLSTMKGWCECQLFQFMGIPCGHLVKVFLRHDFEEIPESFILRRWIQGANHYRITDGTQIVEGAKNSRLLKVLHETQLANHVIQEASEDDECFTMLVETLTAFAQKMSEHKAQRPPEISVASNVVIEEPTVDSSPEELLNPNVSQTKGRPKNTKSSTRMKRSLEHNISKERQCKACKEWGTGHDSRNCPNPKPPNPKRGRTLTTDVL